jgi:DNA-binding winged helix-turn-helix (wHTH) protein
MQTEQILRFGPYRFDPAQGQLWRGTHTVKLLPKAVAVLRYFVEHPGQLVTKDDLFQAIWPETVVSEATLTSCIQELRQALRDDARKPRYIETVHRRGYRFLPALTILPVSSQQLAVSSQREDSRDPSAVRTPHSALSLVGREAELQQLHGWLEKALQGERQLVFVTGEPGIGKTTLVEAFLQSLESGVQRQKAKFLSPTLFRP